MKICWTTTEDRIKIANAFSNASSMKDFIAEYGDSSGKAEVELENVYVFEKNNALATVFELKTGEYIGTSSLTVNDSIEFLYNLNDNTLPEKVIFVECKAKNSNRTYMNVLGA